MKKDKRLWKRIKKIWKMTYRNRMTDIHGSILIIMVLLQIICLILIAIVSSSPSFILSFYVSHLSFGCLLPTQLLVQALVIYYFDHWKAHEVGLPLCAVKVLQMAHNAAGHLVFNQPKRPHVTLLLINLLWLSMTDPNRIQVTNAAFRVTSRSAPIYLNWNVKKPYVPQPLGSCCLVMPSLPPQNGLSPDWCGLGFINSGAISYQSLSEQRPPLLSSWRLISNVDMSNLHLWCTFHFN